MTLEDELKRLSALRERSTVVASAVERHRADVLRFIRETGEVRVSGALDPEENPARDVDAKCKKLELQRVAAEAEINKLVPEIAPLAREIEKIERGIGAKVHTGKLAKQTQVREGYRSVVVRLLEAANALSKLSHQAMAIFSDASREFPAEEHASGQDIVFRSAGLREVWDPAWIGYGDVSRRDVVVGNIFDYDRSLVDPADRVAINKMHQEEHNRRRSREIEAERKSRTDPDMADFERENGAARKRGETVVTVKVHPRTDGRPHRGQ
jgi:hypothetical protein